MDELEMCLSDRMHPELRFVFTGSARAIQSLKKRLKNLPWNSSNVSVKPCWAPGKVGLI